MAAIAARTNPAAISTNLFSVPCALARTVIAAAPIRKRSGYIGQVSDIIGATVLTQSGLVARKTRMINVCTCTVATPGLPAMRRRSRTALDSRSALNAAVATARRKGMSEVMMSDNRLGSDTHRDDRMYVMRITSNFTKDADGAVTVPMRIRGWQ